MSSSSSSAPLPSLPSLPFTELKDEDAILNFIFDPHRSFIGGNPSASGPKQSAAEIALALQLAQQNDPLWKDHVTFTDEERRAVAAAEAGDLDGAQAILDRLCSTDCPDRASSFNNRAQLGRLRTDKAKAGPTGGGGSSSSASSSTEEASSSSTAVKGDLDRAVTLAEAWLAAHPESEEQDATIGPTRKKLRTFHKTVLQQALTQRSLYHRTQGDTEAELRDLRAAATAGSVLAQAVSTGMNPYATLCNDTVAVMLQNALPAKQQGQAEGAAGKAESES